MSKAERYATWFLAVVILTFLITFTYLVFKNKPIRFTPPNYIPLLFEVHKC